MLDEMFQQNSSKVAILLEYENPHNFFVFHFMICTFFPLMNVLAGPICVLVYVCCCKSMANFEAFRWNISLRSSAQKLILYRGMSK